MHNPEHQASAEVKTGSVEAAAEQQSEKLRNAEKSVESSPENAQERAENARRDTEAAFSREAGREHRSGGEPDGTAAAIRRVTVEEKRRAYRETLTRAQAQMSPRARAFSKVIHSPVIERASDAAATTIARPNALLLGAIVAFCAVSITYIIGRTYGYRLSGFEMIGSYVLGWVVGIIADYVRVMIGSGTRARS